MGKLRPFVRKDSYMPNKKWIPFVIGNGYTTTDGASGPAPEYETVTGNPVTFNAITPFPLRQLSVAFSPVQEGTGDPSPDNVRPILGWDSLNVEQRGKNLVDPATKEQTSQSVARWYYANGFMLRAGQTYTLSSDISGVTVYITEKATDATIKTGETATFTPTQDTLVYFRAYLSSGIANVNLQLELGTTPSTFVPFNPSSRSISISLGSTVYSGVLDVVTGVLTVDMAEVDMGAFGWKKDTANNGFYGSIATGTLLPKGNAYGGGIAEEYKPAQYTQVKGKSFNACFNIAATTHYIYLYDSTQEAATAEEFKTHVTGQKLVYELATPLTIQLTPQEVESLLGENNMWSNANQPITVEYRKN